jgi:DNA-binding transcriptional LysR family regulator
MASVSRRRAEWSDLRLFWAVAELGAFGAAARALGVSQSTITRRIDELECRLNTRLFVRTPQGVALTDAGREAIDHVRTMELSAEALENLILDSEDRAEGAVGLAAPDGVAGIFMTPFMAEFTRANPKIALRIDCGLWPDHPLKGDADLCLTFTEPTQADLVARPIAYFHYGLFAAPSYLDLYGAPSSLPQGVTHAYIHHTAQMHQPERWHPQASAFRDMVDTRVETNSSAVSFSAVKHGVGIGLMPTAILSLEPSLVMLDTPHLGRLKLWLCYHRDIGKAARIRRVIDWIREVFDATTKPWYRAEFVHPRDFMHLVPGAPALAEPPRQQAPDDETGSKVALRAR